MGFSAAALLSVVWALSWRTATGFRIKTRRKPLRGANAASNPYECTVMNITDGVKCGTRMLEDAFSCGWRDCKIFGMSSRCPQRCLVNNTCEAEAMCTFRIRAEMRGVVTTQSFDSVSIDFGVTDHRITQGPPGVKDLLNNVSQSEAVKALISETISKQVHKVQKKVDQYKIEFMEMLANELGRDDVFGDLSWVRSILGNSTELVQRLLPYSKLHVNAYGNDALRPVVEVPEARAWAEARLCFTVSDNSIYWMRLLPFLVISALAAFRLPRTAAVLLVLGIVASSSWVVQDLCERMAPSMVGNSEAKFQMASPREVRDLGFVPEVEFRTSFSGHALVADFVPIPEEAIAEVIRRAALATSDVDGVLPWKVVDGRFVLRAGGLETSLAAGTWFDLDAKLDARCAPSCQGCKLFMC